MAAFGQRDAMHDLFDAHLPLLLRDCQHHAQGDLALTRILPLLEATLKRSAYLVLLIENPPARERLVDLCAASPWMADLLARYPVLLDELLNAGWVVVASYTVNYELSGLMLHFILHKADES